MTIKGCTFNVLLSNMLKGVFISVSVLLGLCACSGPNELISPCPHYGAYCQKVPVNAWESPHNQPEKGA